LFSNAWLVVLFCLQNYHHYQFLLIDSRGHNDVGTANGRFIVHVHAPGSATPQALWRLPRFDVNHPPHWLNPCNGQVQDLLAWGVGKSNSNGNNHYWQNNDNKVYMLNQVTLAVASGQKPADTLSHAVCLHLLDPSQNIVAQSCAFKSNGIYNLGWNMPPGYIVSIQARNKCPKGGVWNVVMFLHVYARETVAAPQTQPQPVQPSIPNDYPNSGRLNSGQSLQRHQGIRSGNGQYLFVNQGDGNFVMYGPGNSVLFNANTVNRGQVITMQPDGNLVIRDGTGRSIWDTATSNYPGAFLAVQDDGNLCLYQPGNGRAIWCKK